MSASPANPASGFGASDPVVLTGAGLSVPGGGFHVDPWEPVERAVITHGHADHATRGCGSYLCTPETEAILRVRLGRDIDITPLPLGRPLAVGDAAISLHPAGHVLGSAQVRIDAPRRDATRGRETWVISGDYGTQPNPTCAAFEPVPCDVFISECTFGLPIYRWPDPSVVARELNRWWTGNADRGRSSVVFAYALGKAQRVLSMLDRSIGPVLVHGAMRRLTEVYRAAGVDLPETPHATAASIRAARGRAMVVAPPSAAGSPWLRRFDPASTAFASGWMRVRGARRRRAADRGFVLSDHADWDGLLEAIAATGAERIGVTHGSVEIMARRLQELGHRTAIYPTRYEATPDVDVDAGFDAAADETAPEAAAETGAEAS